ncbi:hypothetical protein T10_7091, partial [Trichinella papuae]
MKSDGLSVDEYWRQFGEVRGKAQWSGNGYQRERESSKVDDDGNVGQSSMHLKGKPHLVAMPMLPALLDVDTLGDFRDERVHRARSPNIYEGPMLLVHQSPPAHSGRLN